MREPPRPAPERIKPVVAIIKAAKPASVGDWRNQRPVFVKQLPPCSAGCPASEQIRDYIALALQDKMAEAWHLIKEDNPIPAVMGRVCYHPCESKCNRVEFDEAIAIHCLERRIGDYGLQQGLRVDAPTKNAHKIAVIGSGPAGLSAAYHMARRGYRVTVYDAGAEPGGMLRYGIPSYRLPKDVLDAEIAGIAALGVDFVNDAALGKNLSWDALRDFDGVVLSVGCSVGRSLDIPGAGQSGVYDGLSFLHAVNSGAGMPDIAGAKVLVIGGGNVAIDVGRVAKRLGAREVSMAFLESENKMPAYPEEQADARAEGVSFLPGRHFLEFQSAGGRVSGVRCVRISSFRFEPQSGPIVDVMPNSEHVLEADVVVVAIGQQAALGFLPLELADKWTAVAAGAAARSGRHWIVGAGDAAEGPSSVVRAVGGGKRAAKTLDALLQGRDQPVDEHIPPVGFERLNMAYFANAPRRQPPHGDPAVRILGFDEVVGELPNEAFRAEAERCFHCGDCNFCSNCWVFCPEASIQKSGDVEGANGLPRFEVEYNSCKGCGICMHECPRAAIVMQEEAR